MATAMESGQQASPAAASASQGVREMADQAKDRAHAVWDDAREGARSRLNEEKDAAAESMDGMAKMLRDAARRTEGERDGLAGLADSAAEGLERLCGTLRNKEVGAMARDVESFARNQPVAFFGIALAVGFLAVRFMKSGDPLDTQREQSWT